MDPAASLTSATFTSSPAPSRTVSRGLQAGMLNRRRSLEPRPFVRLHQKPDCPDIIVALAPVIGMDLIRFCITGGVGLDLVDDQAGIGENR